MNWSVKKVLVTGAGGFIGSHLVEELASAGAQVRAFVRYNSRGDWGHLSQLENYDNIETISGDIRDAAFVQKAMESCEIVFNLAALIGIPYSYHAPESYLQTNVYGTLNVLQAGRTLRVRKIIQTSTSETYGTAQYAPIDEKHPLQGQSPYSASKIASDKLAESFYLSFGVPVATIRPFNTFGPRQSARAVIPTVLSQLAQKAPVLKVGFLSPMRDFTYVKDTAKGFMAVAASEKSTGEVINIGSGKEISIGALIELCCEIAGYHPKIETDGSRVRPEESEVQRLICDNKKARELTGWEPEFTFKQGLEATFNYLKENLKQYKPDAYNV